MALELLGSCLLCVGLLVASLLVWKWLFSGNPFKDIPTPGGLPLIGMSYHFAVGPTEFFKRVEGIARRYGGLVHFNIGPTHYTVLSSAKYVEVILNSNRHIEKSVGYNYLHPWLGTGLLTSTGGKWHFRRKLLTPSFHFKILEDFTDVFNEQSRILVELLRPKCDGDANQGAPFDLFPFIARCTLDIICETAMGMKTNAQKDTDSEYVWAIYRICEIIQMRQTRVWLFWDFLFRLSSVYRDHQKCLSVLHGVTNQMIKEKKEEAHTIKMAATDTPEDMAAPTISGARKRRLAFLDLLIETSDDGRLLSDLDIREEVDTFMFEGHDTTAAGISWCLFLLGNHPEIQDQVYEEMRTIFGDNDRDATSEDLRNMKCLERCLKEALRLYPSVPFLARYLREPAVIGGHEIPANTDIVVFTYMLHRDPAVFPDPERFDPDRFLPENTTGRNPFAYIPFSAGPRNCIGQRFAMMEEKIVLSHIVRNFRIRSTVTQENMAVRADIILRPSGEIPVVLSARN